MSSNLNRQPAGTPAGGQFAAGSTSEGTGVALGEPPSTLAELGLSPGETMTLDDYDTGSQVFEQVQITASEAGDFIVEGHAYMDLEAGLEPSGGTAAERADWLHERRHVIEASVHDRYGAALMDNDEGTQHLVFTSRMPADATTDQVLVELATSTRSQAAHYDLSTSPDYAGSRFFTCLRHDLDDHAHATDQATAAYERALELAETDGDVGTVRISPAARAQAREDVSRFLVENRHLIVEVQTSQHGGGGPYGHIGVGHDLAYTRAGMGPAFDNSGLGEYGRQLQEAADKLPPLHTWVDKDGDVHAEAADG